MIDTHAYRLIHVCMAAICSPVSLLPTFSVGQALWQSVCLGVRLFEMALQMAMEKVLKLAEVLRHKVSMALRCEPDEGA